MARGSKRQGTSLPSPFLKRLWLERPPEGALAQYPLVLPVFRDGLELRFENPVTILVGENGVGKSTLIEGMASLFGYDDAGGGLGYRPVDHAKAEEVSGGVLAASLKAAWLPKVTSGWFFKAETFFSVARYLDETARDAGEAPPDFLSHSHGEGFLRFFEERCSRPGLYLFDEPESALSPMRQIEFLKILKRMQQERHAQAIIATHSPLIMALPGASLFMMTNAGVDPVQLRQVPHFRLLREFFADPEVLLEAMLD